MRFLPIILLTTLFLCACSGGGGSDNSSVDRVTVGLTDFASAPEVESAYSVVVGIPYVPSDPSQNPTTIYDGLYTNLTNSQAQANLPISRVLLSVVAPNNNGVFSIDKSSIVYKFLKQISDYNNQNPSKAIQILAYPDVEENSPWLSWPIPTLTKPIASCTLAKTTSATNFPAQKSMLLSICWASAMNQLIDSNVIAGVVYDQQSNWLKKIIPTTQVSWTYTQAHNDSLLIGWISANGVAPSAGQVDLNFVEVYDLYSNGGPYYDTVAPETVISVSPQFLPPTTPTQKPICTGLLCEYDFGFAYPNSDGSYKSFFPGPQFTYGSTGSVIGAVGANIYQCALSKGSSTDLCTTAYSDNVDITLDPNAQMMQAINYIKTGKAKFIPALGNKYPYYGLPKVALSGNVIYLFSTQYIGPLESYFGTKPPQSSGNQCSDTAASPANACSCLASKYSPNAFCGGENGFGTWSSAYSEFVKFTALFLSSQGGTSCPGQSCSAGIYMYDFIPQAWYPKQ